MGRDHQSENVLAFIAIVQATIQDKPTCRHYGHFGHEEANYYEIIRYPPSWESHCRGHGSCGGWTEVGMAVATVAEG